MVKKLLKKVFGRTRGTPRRGKWTPWTSHVGLALVQSRLAGRWREK